MGTALRISLVLGWLLLYGIHASDYLLKDLGLVENFGAPALIAAHSEKHYHYRLVDPQDETVQFGTSEVSVATVDTFFQIGSKLRVPDIARLPGMQMLQTAGMEGPLVLDGLVNMDDRYRLVDLVATGSLLGYQGTIEGSFDHRGLSGKARVSGMGNFRFDVPDIDTEGTTGFDLSTVLPAGLQVGQRFANKVLIPSPTPPHLQQSYAYYSVEETIEITTATDTRPGVIVIVNRDDKDTLKLEADLQGVVHRASVLDQNLVMILEKITDPAGDEVWPVDRRPPPEESAAEIAE